jgi:(1->4)-alpha-D-glucan 1-alpha-D-glucosylmutase
LRFASEDALGLEDQPNMPGTIEQQPNWRRRYRGEAGNCSSSPACVSGCSRWRSAKTHDAAGSTIRLQLHRGFTFETPLRLRLTLQRCVSHLYLSPILTARGFDVRLYVADPTRVNPELGGEEASDGWCAAPQRTRNNPRHRPQPHGDWQ